MPWQRGDFIHHLNMNIALANDNNFENILSENNKVIVKYYADWCGSCKLFSPKYKRLSADERFIGISFMDVNAEENELARKKAGVDNLPFFAIFHNGILIEATAAAKEEAVVDLLDKLKAL